MSSKNNRETFGAPPRHLPMNAHRSILVVVATLVLSLAACNADDETPSESITRTSEPLMGADCSGSLGVCYQTCQAQAPTPTADCFTNCQTTFYGCISPAESILQQ